MRSFIQASRLRRWISRPGAPVWIQECKMYFDEAFGSRLKDNSTSSSTNSRTATQPVPADLRALVGLNVVALRAHYTYLGVTYSRSSTHLGNSLVLYHPGGDILQRPVAGSIKYIYTMHDQTRLAVQRQQSAPITTRNPFQRYPHFPAQIYSTQLVECVEEVCVSWILCHYARWNMEEGICVLLLLFRVRSAIFSLKDKY